MRKMHLNKLAYTFRLLASDYLVVRFTLQSILYTLSLVETLDFFNFVIWHISFHWHLLQWNIIPVFLLI